MTTNNYICPGPAGEIQIGDEDEDEEHERLRRAHHRRDMSPTTLYMYEYGERTREGLPLLFFFSVTGVA